MDMLINCKIKFLCDYCDAPLSESKKCMRVYCKFNKKYYYFCNEDCRRNYIDTASEIDWVNVRDMIKATKTKMFSTLPKNSYMEQPTYKEN